MTADVRKSSSEPHTSPSRPDASGSSDKTGNELAASVRQWVSESARAFPTGAVMHDAVENAMKETAATPAEPDAALTRAVQALAGGRSPLPVRPSTTTSMPHRDTSAGVRESRVALLIDSAALDQETLDKVLASVHAAYGRPALSRAYGDWTLPELRGPLNIFKSHGVQPVHEFSAGAAHTLVALTVDALDAVRDYGVNSIVLVVADLESVLPLITRLRASGTHVVAVGPATTPPDLRNHADVFIDIPATAHHRAQPHAGRHRSDGPTDRQAATP